MFWGKPKWSAVPGCYERHLQRRTDNQLFPIERRKVSKSEIREAKERDQSEQDHFIAAVKNLGAEMERSEDREPGSTVQDSTYLQKVQSLLEFASAIGGNIQNAVRMLERTETDMIQHLNRQIPAGVDLLEKARSLSVAARNPFFAQSTRKNTPVQPGEEVPMLLSESLETISRVGYFSRSFPGFRPSTADIKANLDNAVGQGFNRNRAEELLAAWNRTTN